ncbi:hypothetical protein Cni_G09766 [Canna indica]|uniref:Uncharacterized protein n=1 Tax=Canna indica TaxID=4628 RepID=A0AAQ3K331_9LILI|nr:hypothetical protein Cni_G09766 [Canna indica]
MATTAHKVFDQVLHDLDVKSRCIMRSLTRVSTKLQTSESTTATDSSSSSSSSILMHWVTVHDRQQGVIHDFSIPQPPLCKSSNKSPTNRSSNRNMSSSQSRPPQGRLSMKKLYGKEKVIEVMHGLGVGWSRFNLNLMLIGRFGSSKENHGDLGYNRNFAHYPLRGGEPSWQYMCGAKEQMNLLMAQMLLKSHQLIWTGDVEPPPVPVSARLGRD